MKCYYDARLDRYRLIATWDEMGVLGIYKRGELRKMFQATNNSSVWLAKANGHDEATQNKLKEFGIEVTESKNIREILSDYLEDDVLDEVVERIEKVTVYKMDYERLYFKNLGR